LHYPPPDSPRNQPQMVSLKDDFLIDFIYEQSQFNYFIETFCDIFPWMFSLIVSECSEDKKNYFRINRLKMPTQNYSYIQIVASVLLRMNEEKFQSINANIKKIKIVIKIKKFTCSSESSKNFFSYVDHFLFHPPSLCSRSNVRINILLYFFSYWNFFSLSNHWLQADCFLWAIFVLILSFPFFYQTKNAYFSLIELNYKLELWDCGSVELFYVFTFSVLHSVSLRWILFFCVLEGKFCMENLCW